MKIHRFKLFQIQNPKAAQAPRQRLAGRDLRNTRRSPAIKPKPKRKEPTAAARLRAEQQQQTMLEDIAMVEQRQKAGLNTSELAKHIDEFFAIGPPHKPKLQPLELLDTSAPDIHRGLWTGSRAQRRQLVPVRRSYNLDVSGLVQPQKSALLKPSYTCQQSTRRPTPCSKDPVMRLFI